MLFSCQVKKIERIPSHSQTEKSSISYSNHDHLEFFDKKRNNATLFQLSSIYRKRFIYLPSIFVYRIYLPFILACLLIRSFTQNFTQTFSVISGVFAELSWLSVAIYILFAKSIGGNYQWFPFQHFVFAIVILIRLLMLKLWKPHFKNFLESNSEFLWE